jgi:hypothetical protein
MQVMTLLDHVFTWQRSTGSSSSQDTAAAADPAGVRQLLLGCAELLRPAANCSVEWRCAALALMSEAVECFMDSCPGNAHHQTHGVCAVAAVLSCAWPLMADTLTACR